MPRRHPFRVRPPLSALLAVTFLLFATPAVAGAQQEYTADVQVLQADGKSNALHFLVGAEHARIDASSERGDVSIVYGPDWVRMIMHPQRIYMEFTREMLERMRQMMERMGRQVQESAAAEVPENVHFERTDRTETIGSWNAFAVEATNEDTGETTTLWLTEDTDVGLFEVMGSLAEKLESMALPGMQGGSPLASMEKALGVAHAQGLPPGRVVRVQGTSGSTITLQNVQPGPIDPSAWQPPEGYRKQQMPMMQR